MDGTHIDKQPVGTWSAFQNWFGKIVLLESDCIRWHPRTERGGRRKTLKDWPFGNKRASRRPRWLPIEKTYQRGRIQSAGHHFAGQIQFIASGLFRSAVQKHVDHAAVLRSAESLQHIAGHVRMYDRHEGGVLSIESIFPRTGAKIRSGRIQTCGNAHDRDHHQNDYQRSDTNTRAKKNTSLDFKLDFAIFDRNWTFGLSCLWYIDFKRVNSVFYLFI